MNYRLKSLHSRNRTLYAKRPGHDHSQYPAVRPPESICQPCVPLTFTLDLRSRVFNNSAIGPGLGFLSYASACFDFRLDNKFSR